MTTAFIYFGCSLGVLILVAGVFRVEDAQGGQRVVLGSARILLDRLVRWVIGRLAWLCAYVRHSVARLFLHYTADRILARLYAMTHFLEEKTEELLRQDKRTTRRVNLEHYERSHLNEIADYRKEKALTEEQIEKMRSLD